MIPLCSVYKIHTHTIFLYLEPLLNSMSWLEVLSGWKWSSEEGKLECMFVSRHVKDE